MREMLDDGFETPLVLSPNVKPIVAVTQSKHVQPLPHSRRKAPSTKREVPIKSRLRIHLEQRPHFLLERYESEDPTEYKTAAIKEIIFPSYTPEKQEH